jgi:hypothetical protein
MSAELISKALGDVLLQPQQQAWLENRDGRVRLLIDNLVARKGVEIAPCPGCDKCGESKHLTITPYDFNAETPEERNERIFKGLL